LNGEIGFWLSTDGSRTPFLHLETLFIYYQAYPEMIQGALYLTLYSSLNVIAGGGHKLWNVHITNKKQI
jgi:hypothetical protein